MALPALDEAGDLPAGRHTSSLEEVVARFGSGSPQRIEVTSRLRRVHALAVATGYLDCILIFGSYVTNKPEPNDVDVILVMCDDFHRSEVSDECDVLFDHSHADEVLGASVFWIRPEALMGQSVEDFLEFFQTRRDGKRRGVVEIRHDPE